MRIAYRHHASNEIRGGRILFLAVCLALAFIAIMGRLFFIQVIAHYRYQKLADDQHLRKADYTAQRGQVFAHDHTNEPGDALYPLAVNKTFYEVYIVPNEISQPVNTAEVLSTTLG